MRVEEVHLTELPIYYLSHLEVDLRNGLFLCFVPRPTAIRKSLANSVKLITWEVEYSSLMIKIII